MLRRIAPTLGLVALLVPAASAQDIAKGVTLSGWVDTTSITQTNTTAVAAPPSDNGGTYSTFGVTGDVKVGWKANEQVSALIDLRAPNGAQSAVLFEQAYITLAPTEILTISAGTSYGPMGYYAAEPTGGFAVTTPLNDAYGNNPTGVWATVTPSGKFNATVVVADDIVGAAPGSAVPNGTNRNGIGGFALDLVFNPIDEVSLNLEGAADVSGGAKNGTDALGSATWIGFNGQYKKDALTAAGEVWAKQWAKTENNGSADPTNYDDTKQWSAMGLVNYALPGTSIPTSLSAIASYLSTSADVAGSSEDDKMLKLTVAALTNPLSTDSFGLNFEVSYIKDTPADSTLSSEASFLFAVEGLVQLK